MHRHKTLPPLPPLNNPAYYLAKTIFDFRVADLHGKHIKLDVYEGCVCIIVNTASKCKMADLHFTQFSKLLAKYGESQGLRILAFPCNQFDQGEPGSSMEIAKHAYSYKIKFAIFDKVNVNCNNAIPLYKFLKSRLRGNKLGDMIKGNFTKFIVNRAGVPVERYEMDVFPMDMEEKIKYYLKQRYKRRTTVTMSHIGIHEGHKDTTDSKDIPKENEEAEQVADDKREASVTELKGKKRKSRVSIVV